MSFSITSLVRLFLIVVMGANALAVVMGSLGPPPRPAVWRAGSAVRYQCVDRKDRGFDRETLLHDLEAGGLGSLDLDEGVQMQHAACSPSRDQRGESQLVGLMITRTCEGTSGRTFEIQLARLAYPSGQVLDRIASERMPANPPCWYPGRSDRILFGSGDGKLYQYSFKGTHTASGSAPEADKRPRQIAWRTAPPGYGGVNLRDPSWPTDSRWGGKLVVSLCAVDQPDADQFGPERIWWLGLNDGGTAIESAGCLLQLDPARVGEALGGSLLSPTTANLDGRVILAYLKMPIDTNRRDLCLAEVEFDPETSAPFVRPESIRQLEGRCGLTAPSFSADGREITCVLDPCTPSARLARFSVESILEDAKARPLWETLLSSGDPAHDLDDAAASE